MGWKQHSLVNQALFKHGLANVEQGLPPGFPGVVRSQVQPGKTAHRLEGSS